eukprot:gnl/Ergobibamus_cyprinoides/3916.p1 GENE.gnl/Ergobibamus_cyprinoides/3916~~gnl/Ergobibamus_cyprinoides/3916.p1  ORF type:complete len:175 (+),score=11.99 gnl/Ergobibamus_cyprinoides/3916:456-980(+)
MHTESLSSSHAESESRSADSIHTSARLSAHFPSVPPCPSSLPPAPARTKSEELVDAFVMRGGAVGGRASRVASQHSALSLIDRETDTEAQTVADEGLVATSAVSQQFSGNQVVSLARVLGWHIVALLRDNAALRVRLNEAAASLDDLRERQVFAQRAEPEPGDGASFPNNSPSA